MQEFKSGSQWQRKGGIGVGGGREVQEGEDICMPMADVRQKPTQYCTAIILQLKINWRKKEQFNDLLCRMTQESGRGTIAYLIQLPTSFWEESRIPLWLYEIWIAAFLVFKMSFCVFFRFYLVNLGKIYDLMIPFTFPGSMQFCTRQMLDSRQPHHTPLWCCIWPEYPKVCVWRLSQPQETGRRKAPNPCGSRVKSNIMLPKAEKQQQEEVYPGRRSPALPCRLGNEAPHYKAPCG